MTPRGWEVIGVQGQEAGDRSPISSLGLADASLNGPGQRSSLGTTSPRKTPSRTSTPRGATVKVLSTEVGKTFEDGTGKSFLSV